MEKIKTIGVLKEWDAVILNKLIEKLNNNYLVSDEEGIGLSSTMIENWTSECDDYLRSNGYTGGDLNECSYFFSGHGAVYVLYDESHISYDDALEYIAEVANREDSLFDIVG